MAVEEGKALGPRIEIEPETALADEALHIGLAGFGPRQRVELKASLVDDAGNVWESRAAFTCDADGAVDLARRKPDAGTYGEADATGLLWSMVPKGVKDTGIYVKSNSEAKRIAFSAEVNGVAVATQEIERTYLAPGCERIPVDEEGITGTYFKPAVDGPRPPVIVMHGTSNRIMEDRGALLASRGYAVLSLLYFGGKGQPDEYIGIPVEYFEKSIAWLTARPEVREGGVALIGVSRGGEGALLVASKLEQVNAVVSISGGGVIFEGLHKNPREGGPETPWTWRGDPVPFVERKDSLSFTLKAVWSGMSKKPLSTLATYIDGMDNSAAVEDATIKVEDIKGPVLLVSGREDRVWPSSELSRIAATRLKKSGRPFPCEHLDYEGAGHIVFLPCHPTTVGYTRVFSGMALEFGGSPGANARASTESWARVLGFLTQSLG